MIPESNRGGIGFDVREALMRLGIFLVVFLAHVHSPVLRSEGDTSWSIHTAMSVIREGNTDLEEYESLVRRQRFRFASRYEGTIYNHWPDGPSLISLPIIWLIDHTCRVALGVDFNELISAEIPGHVERFIASLYVAVATVFMYLIARRSLGLGMASLTAFVFAFCTMAWTTASRALWTHTPSLLLVTLTLWLLLSAEERPRRIWWAGFTLGLAYVSRSVNLPLAVLITVFVLIHRTRHLAPFLLGAAVIAAAHFAHIYHTYGQFRTPYQEMILLFYREREIHVAEAAAGLLLSPGRGLFIYSPVLLFWFWGAVIALRRRPVRWLDLYLLLSVVGVYGLCITWPKWWGGWSYGPRVLTDIVPILMYFMVIAFARLGELRGLPRRSLEALLGVLTLLSFAIHLIGATSDSAKWWDGRPAEIDQDISRLWDWGNPPFLAPLRALQTEWEIARDEETVRRAAERPDSEGSGEGVIRSASRMISTTQDRELLGLARQVLATEGVSVAEALAQGSASVGQHIAIAFWLRDISVPAEELLAFCDQSLANVQPHVELHLVRSVALQRLGRFEEALATARRARAMDPHNPWSSLYIGDALHALGQEQQALRIWERCRDREEAGFRHEVEQRLARHGSPE